MVDFKNQKLDLLLACNDYVKHRVQTAKQAIASARDAANNDAKSSAGDKYETTREMMNQEISRNEQLLSIAMHMQQILNRIDEKKVQRPFRLVAWLKQTTGLFLSR